MSEVEEVKELNREEIITEYLSSKDFVDRLNAEKGKAIENFQKEKLPTILETEFEKRMRLEEEKKKKTPEQIALEDALKRIEHMEAASAAEKREKMRIENKLIAQSELSSRNLNIPEPILDKFISEEKEKTTEQIKLFTDFMDDYTTKMKSEKVKSNNTFVPGENKTSGGDVQTPGDKASQAEWENYFKLKNKK